MPSTQKKLIVLVTLAVLAGLFFLFDLQRYFSFAFLKQQQQSFDAFYQGHQGLTILLYMLIYIVVTALSLPGATVMTLAGGAMLGLWLGVLVVSFASSIGATLAFLVSRYLLRDFVQKKFSDKLGPINRGMAKDGAFYLFSLRLVPIFPFFIINLVMGLTPIKTWTFYVVSQVGMLAGTFVYVNAGTQLGQLESAEGILSPGLLISFALLGIFPLVAKKILAFIKKHRALKRFPPPSRFDYNVVVIGAGSAGLVTSYIAAAVKAKVALIEKDRMGGDCLNTGCVPSKALIRSAKMISYLRRAKEFGLQTQDPQFEFAEVMDRVQRVIGNVAPHDSVQRYTGLGVECISGAARITSPYTVEVNGRVLTTRSIVVASGARPFVPPIPGLDKIDYLTSDNLWQLRSLPRRLVVLGGGPIGCEMTQAFARLGSEVTQVEMAPRIMGREDPEISQRVQQRFEKEGIRVLVGHKAKEVRSTEGGKVLVCERDGSEVAIPFDAILVAVGRVANSRGFGLEELGVTLTPRGTLDNDEFLRTSIPTIYCAGDVAGPYQFTHTAGHQAWYAAVNALFSPFKSFKADYRVIPWATFTDPEVARVGLNETDAQVAGIPYEVTRYGLDDLDRAIADSEAHGLVKVLTKPGTDKILGVTIVGNHASDIIAEYILAMKHGIGLNKILGTIHIYPTLAEANKMAAGVWKREHAPQKILAWLERFHAWRRNGRTPKGDEA